MKSHWNYRILRFVQHDQEYFEIHEVHYKDGKPVSYGKPAATVYSETLEGLDWVQEKMNDAMNKPVLDTENWPKEYEVRS